MLNSVQIAMICHEANAAYCRSIGDDSQPSWDNAPDNIKASAVDGVKFHLENPFATPENSHENWMKGKVADGWVYGEVKDMEKKTHYCLVPYTELSEAQKVKDYLFRAVVHGLAKFQKESSYLWL